MYVTLQWCFSAYRDKGKALGDFFFFWLYWVSISCMAISLFETSGGYSLLAVRRLLIAVAALVTARRLQCTQAYVAVAPGR